MESVMPVLQGGNDDVQSAADELQLDPIGLSVDGILVKGKINAVGETVHTQIVASNANPIVISAIEHVTQDAHGTFCPLGAVLAPSSSLSRTCKTGCGGVRRVGR
eukprot:5586859-Prymnesium_polylepis.1